MIDEIIVITCPVLSVARWASIHNQLDEFDAKITKYTGVSKYKLTTKQKQIFNNHYRDGTSCDVWPEGEMAVALSHYGVWQYIVTNQKWCCVLEDDAIVNRNLNTYLNEYTCDEATGIVSLFPDGINSGSNGTIVPKPFTNHGLVGYLINPNFAKYLIDEFTTISTPVDHYVYEIQSDYKLLYTTTRYITHDNTKCSLRSITSN